MDEKQIQQKLASLEVEMTAHLEQMLKDNPGMDWHLLGMEANTKVLASELVMEAEIATGRKHYLAFKGKPNGKDGEILFLVSIYPEGEEIPRAFVEV